MFTLSDIGGEPAPVFFKRLGEQGFLVILLVVSNWVVARVLLATQRDRISDLKKQIEDLQRQRDERKHCPPTEPEA